MDLSRTNILRYAAPRCERDECEETATPGYDNYCWACWVKKTCQASGCGKPVVPEFDKTGHCSAKCAQISATNCVVCVGGLVPYNQDFCSRECTELRDNMMMSDMMMGDSDEEEP